MPYRRPIVLMLDVEPDERRAGETDPWLGTQAAVEAMAAWRVEAARRTGTTVQLNWFLRLDPQVEKLFGRVDFVPHSLPALIASMERHQDHAGIHTHLCRQNPAGRWYSEFTDVAWLEHCLRGAVDAFTRNFGRPPVASRMGDRWLSNDAVRLLIDLGLRYECTVEPGLPDMPIFDDPLATAWLPDYRPAPRHPYRPRAGNFLQAGDQPLWILPLSTTPLRLRPVRRPPYLVRGSYPLNLSLSPRAMLNHLDNELARVTREPLVLVIRTGDFGVPHWRPALERNLARILAHPGLAHSQFVDVPTAVATWADA